MKTDDITRRHFHGINAITLLVYLLTQPEPTRRLKKTFMPQQPLSYFQKQPMQDPPGRPHFFIKYL